MKKKIILTALLVLALCCICPIASFAAETVVTQHGEVAKGEIITFEVRLSEEVADVKSGSISISYDLEIFEVVSSEWHIDALIKGFDVNTGKGVWASNNSISVGDLIFSITLKVKEDANYGDASIDFKVNFESPSQNGFVEIETDKSDVYISCLDHNAGAAATCTEPQTCTVCGFALAPALGHNFTDAVVDADGHRHTCGRCGQSEGTDNVALCTEDKICPVCNAVTVPASGHSHGTEWIRNDTGHWYECHCGDKKDFSAHNSTEVDCLEDQICSDCGYVVAEAPGHTPGPAADCLNDQVCTACGETLEEAVGHSYSTEWTSDGTSHWHACICGEKKDISLHTPGADADCVNAKACTVCRQVITPAKGHTYGTEWKTDSNGHWRECVCGEKTLVLKHSPGLAPNCTSDQTCLMCGYVLAEKTGHSFSDYKPDNNATCAKSGTETAFCLDPNCTGTDTRVIANSILEHSFKNGVCTVCNAKDEDRTPVWVEILVFTSAAAVAVSVIALLNFKKIKAAFKKTKTDNQQNNREK